MAYTQQDLDTLRKMMAKGVLKLEKGDERLTFRSLAEMKDLEREMAADIAGRSRSRVHYPEFSRGTD